MTSKLNVVDYEDQVENKNVYQGYSVETNGYWITITKNERGTGRETKNVVFERKPMIDGWLDQAHNRIASALSELEAAIVAAICTEELTKEVVK